MKLQMDLPKELNKKIKIEKLMKNFNTIQEVMIYILEEYFKNKLENQKIQE